MRSIKNSPITVLLVALLAASAIFTVVLSLRFVWSVRELQNLQLKVAVANQDRMKVNALFNEAYEYSKRNAAINPLLESVGLKPKPPAPAPAPKPLTK